MKKTIQAMRSLFLIFGIGISSWAPMVPFVKDRLDLNESELGILLLIFGMGAIVMMPISGWLMSRMGSRLLILISGLCMLTMIPFLAVASTFFWMGLTLFLFGISTSAMNVSINAQAIIVESQAKQTLMSGFHCFFSLGGLLGAGLVGLLLEANYTLLFCASMISFLIALTIVSQQKKLLENHSGMMENKNQPFVFPENRVFILGLLCFIAFVAEGSMLDWSAEFLCTSLNYSDSQAGIGYAVFSIAMALGRLLGDKLIARFDVYKMFQAGGLLAASGFATLISSPFPYIELLGFFLIGFGASNIVPILFSASGKIFPSHVALTIVTSFGYAGLLIGPGLIGLVANSFSLPVALSGIAVLLIVSGIFGPIFLKISPSKAKLQLKNY